MKHILILVMLALTAPSVFANPATQTADPIESIRQHYTQINRNSRLYRKIKKELSGFSGEGGELVAYFHGPSIMKMAATFYGETGKATEEYYYWDGKLIFVLNTDFRYDKPLSGKVVKTTENRFYFNDDKLIRWMDENGKQVASDSNEYLEKQKEYPAISKLFSDGARSKNPTIESK